MRRADITVAVATLGRPSALMRCIGAILEGETAPAELVIVDQSEDEATGIAVREAPWALRVPVRYVRQPRLGLAASRNAAVALSSQPAIAFTDDDCVPDVGWLAAIAEEFAREPDVDAVTGRILPLGPDGPRAWPVSTRASSRREVYCGRALPWTVGSGGNTTVKRAWLQRVGGFDERLGAGTAGRSAEDTDLLYRLLRAGATLQYEPDAIVRHERKDTAGWLATRSSYGFGMGAFCALWLRRREAYAAWMLARWCADRASALAAACVRRRWRRACGELLMLRGAAAGTAHGLVQWPAATSRAITLRRQHT